MDAAIAANAALGVVEPMSNGVGGDLFAIYWEAKTGKLTGINASGWAPAAMTLDALKAKGHSRMPEEGIHSVTTPGCVAGWDKLHKKFGRLNWAELFRPAFATLRRDSAHRVDPGKLARVDIEAVGRRRSTACSCGTGGAGNRRGHQERGPEVAGPGGRRGAARHFIGPDRQGDPEDPTGWRNDGRRRATSSPNGGAHLDQLSRMENL